jgi:hypothetical protein
MPPKVLSLQQEAIEPKPYHIGIVAQDISPMLKSEAWAH